MSALHLCHVGFIVVERGLSCPSACGILVPQFSSVAQSCPTLCDPMDCSQASLSITNAWSLLKLISIELVMPSNHLVLCHLFFLLPSIFPSLRVFSNESALHIRWPKYWSFRFNISPSNTYIPTFFRFPSNLGHHRAPSRVPCAIQ